MVMTGTTDPKVRTSHAYSNRDWEDVIIRYTKDQTSEWTASQILLSYHGKYHDIDWADVPGSLT